MYKLIKYILFLMNQKVISGGVYVSVKVLTLLHLIKYGRLVVVKMKQD